MKKLILDNLHELFNENVLDDQVKWEYLKYNIRKCNINFSEKLVKAFRKNVMKTMLIT